MAQGRGSCDLYPAWHRPAKVQLPWVSLTVHWVCVPRVSALGLCSLCLCAGFVFPRALLV